MRGFFCFGLCAARLLSGFFIRLTSHINNANIYSSPYLLYRTQEKIQPKIRPET